MPAPACLVWVLLATNVVTIVLFTHMHSRQRNTFQTALEDKEDDHSVEVQRLLSELEIELQNEQKLLSQLSLLQAQYEAAVVHGKGGIQLPEQGELKRATLLVIATGSVSDVRATLSSVDTVWREQAVKFPGRSLPNVMVALPSGSLLPLVAVVQTAIKTLSSLCQAVLHQAQGQDVVGTPFVIMAAKHAVSDASSVAVVEAGHTVSLQGLAPLFRNQCASKLGDSLVFVAADTAPTTCETRSGVSELCGLAVSSCSWDGDAPLPTPAITWFPQQLWAQCCLSPVLPSDITMPFHTWLATQVHRRDPAAPVLLLSTRPAVNEL